MDGQKVGSGHCEIADSAKAPHFAALANQRWWWCNIGVVLTIHHNNV